MIGSSLKRLLSERGMTVRELSEKVNVPVQTLYSIIRRDNMKIDFDVLLRICDALETPLDYFCRASSNAAERGAPTPEEWVLLRRYRALDGHGQALASLVVEQELARVREAQQELTEKTRVIPLYLTPAAAGYASPALEEDYEDYAVDASCKADFAVRIDGDSMEPVIHDGSVALVRREPIENGDVGMFFVDGDMKCKQYCRDNYGNIYLLSINRARADADVTISASSGVTLCCFGKVLLERRPPLPL
ncbi:MAG: XRE family transcriptional regulator [Oscillospiraceae bacterium]|nr:XRE family transcriptional regulator [Oscillospiraceae bacterium]